MVVAAHWFTFQKFCCKYHAYFSKQQKTDPKKWRKRNFWYPKIAASCKKLYPTGVWLFDFLYAKLLANFIAKQISKLGMARHCTLLSCQDVYKYRM